ncbi:MAG TPA: hypothetical protein EYN74_05720 [Nitrospirales bacterium]|nr:hypothetical protein [Nitrospirales bacterium]HIB53498.1 hypothetical protein [Nitrospirales bacterium]
MKFVCLTCEGFMNFENVDAVADNSLGITFGCPTCKTRFSMVTNAGETSLVSSLGVKLGGRTASATPFEMTKETLQGQDGKTATGEGAASGGVCPFSDMLASSGITTGSSASAPSLDWSAEATERIERIPSMIRPMVQRDIEEYARKNGFSSVTIQVMDDAKTSGTDITWAPEAEERLSRLPDFIRPMAKREIERMAKDKGEPEITATIMDAAKTKFMSFM